MSPVVELLERNERPPWIIAHRGVSARCPENTQAAFDAAVDVGADALELDVQLTQDEELVVFHDRTLDRLGHGNKRIRDLDWAELKELDMGSWFDPVFSAERMPALCEVLARYGALLPLCIELKTRDETEERKEIMISTALSAIEEQRLVRTSYLLCFDADVLERIHAGAPHMKLVWNLREPSALRESELATRSWLFAVDGNISGLTPEFTGAGRDHNLVTMSYTCNAREEIMKALACGVDAIISDDPEAARAVVLENE